MTFSRNIVFLIVGTIPILFASVQPWVWSFYTVSIFAAFLILLWQYRSSQSWITDKIFVFIVGLFFVITLGQCLPLPNLFLSFLCPFRYEVLKQSSTIIDTSISWHTLSYYPLNSLTWWTFLLSLFMFSLVFRKCCTSPRDLKLLIWILLGVAFLEALYGLIQALVPTLGVLWVDYYESALGNSRGTYINRNHFAGFIEMILPLGLGYILALGNWQEKINLKALMSSDRPNFQFFLSIGLAIMVMALLFSKSRAGITGGIIGFLTFVFLMRCGTKGLPWSFWAVTFAIIGLVSFYSLKIGIDPILERFLKVGEDTSRIDFWRDSLAIVKDHPFGIGFGTFKQVFPIYNVSTFSDVTPYYLHNDYLQLLVEAGWVGFVALFGGFFIFLVRSFHRIRHMSLQADPLRFFLAIGALSGLVSMAFHSFFDFNLQIPANCVYFVMLISIVHISIWQDNYTYKITTRPLKRIVYKGWITLVLVLLSGWLLVHNWQHRTIFHKDYTFTTEEAKKFKHFPRALYAHGLKAWFQNDSVTAARLFHQTVSQDIFFIDAWIKLAQAEAALGNTDKARTIFKFTDRLTEHVYRWKWSQTLLSHELGIETIFLRNINFLVDHRKMVQDAFQLLDTHLTGNVTVAAHVLDADNLAPFLEWLMRWNRPDDAAIVWNKIMAAGISDEDIHFKYIHFLISKKRVPLAAEIWRSHTGIESMTNSGFEDEISCRGFDWRYTADNKGKWVIRRTMLDVLAGTHSLKIMFEGKENISFAHLYQIVPVVPLTPYWLSYRWRSKDITTDQGPFIDIYGYDCKGLYCMGDMMLGTNDWQEQGIEFSVPENCHAVVIRLRRMPSRRFDNKIEGTLWLDNFKLEKNELLSH